MNNFINTIVEAVLPERYFSSSVFEMKTLAEKYPYAAALQLLLAARLQEADDPSLKNQWQKTLLYFNDPLLLQHQFFTSNSGITTHSSPTADASPAADPDHYHEAEIVEHPHEDGIIHSAVMTAPAQETGATPVNIPGLKFEPVNPAKADMLFTPYYTVDYFASQGIKLSDEVPATDRFGSQLKSFTSWLKDMRRLPDATSGIKLNTTVEAAVEKMAENSLDGQNEETAAMAEVWAKQGNRQKAIEIYQKLSLQNPSKKAYFAAKIEHLKK
ncbi:MAG: hypothetical protein J7539_08470 [Niabella sp.]|nr:hypothetical protein [Niabella sp.]